MRQRYASSGALRATEGKPDGRAHTLPSHFRNAGQGHADCGSTSRARDRSQRSRARGGGARNLSLKIEPAFAVSDQRKRALGL
eukprot:4441591-Prymnesium_polylepis.1